MARGKTGPKRSPGRVVIVTLVSREQSPSPPGNVNVRDSVPKLTERWIDGNAIVAVWVSKAAGQEMEGAAVGGRIEGGIPVGL